MLNLGLIEAPPASSMILHGRLCSLFAQLVGIPWEYAKLLKYSQLLFGWEYIIWQEGLYEGPAFGLYGMMVSAYANLRQMCILKGVCCCSSGKHVSHWLEMELNVLGLE